MEEQIFRIRDGRLWHFNKKIKDAEVEIPAEVTEIGEGVFQNSVNLERIIIPKETKKIGSLAFFGCDNLKEIVIQDGADHIEIGRDAFSVCSNLERITIPESMTDIEGFSFDTSWKLKEIHGPEQILEKLYREADTDFLFKHRKYHAVYSEEIIRTIFTKNPVRNKKAMVTAFIDADDEDGLKALLALGYVSSDKAWEELTAYASSEKKKRILQILSKARKETEKNGKIKKASQKAAAKDLPVNLPDGYLRRKKQLPAAQTLKLLKNEWKESAQIEDYAALWFFQKDEKLAAFCAERMEENPEPALRYLLGLMGEEWEQYRRQMTISGKMERVLRFARENVGHLSKETRSLLYEQLVYAYRRDAEWPPAVQTADGRPAPEEILREAVGPYLLQYIRTAGWSYKDKVWIVPEADEAAGHLDMASFQSALEFLYQEISPAWILPCGRYGNGAQITSLISNMKKWENHAVYGKKGREDNTIARRALLLSDTREAMQELEKLKLLEQYAELRGTDADAVRSEFLYNFGLDASGKKSYDLGTKTIEVSLERDLSLSLFDKEAGKGVKSIPKKGVDPAKAAQAADDFAQMKKNLKKAAGERIKRLFRAFLSGEEESAGKWLDSYTQNGLLRRIGELLVWKQGKESFILTADGAQTCEGAAYTVKKQGKISVAHPMEMEAGEAAAWQRYLSSRGLRQPFAQMWEPVCRAEEVRPDRYAGTAIPAVYFKGMEKHGIGFCYDIGAAELDIRLAGCKIKYAAEGISWHHLDKDSKVTITDFQFQRFTRQANHIVSLLDKWTIRQRIKADDASIAGMLAGVALAQIEEYLALSTEAQAVRCTAVLLAHKRERFGDMDPMDAFVLEE